MLGTTEYVDHSILNTTEYVDHSILGTTEWITLYSTPLLLSLA